MRMFIYK